MNYISKTNFIRFIMGTVMFLFMTQTLLADNVQTKKPVSVREACLNATVKAIELELEKYSKRLENAQKNSWSQKQIDRLRKTLSKLKEEHKKFKNMKVEEYQMTGWTGDNAVFDLDSSGPQMPPIKRYVDLQDQIRPDGGTYFEKIPNNYEIGSMLNPLTTSRSGPFYHIVGVANYDFDKLNKSSEILIYLVYKKKYGMGIENYYVYVSEMK